MATPTFFLSTREDGYGQKSMKKWTHFTTRALHSGCSKCNREENAADERPATAELAVRHSEKCMFQQEAVAQVTKSSQLGVKRPQPPLPLALFLHSHDWTVYHTVNTGSIRRSVCLILQLVRWRLVICRSLGYRLRNRHVSGQCGL